MNYVALNYAYVWHIQFFFENVHLEGGIQSSARTAEDEETTSVLVKRIYANVSKTLDCSLQGGHGAVAQLQDADVTLKVHSIHIVVVIQVELGFGANQLVEFCRQFCVASLFGSFPLSFQVFNALKSGIWNLDHFGLAVLNQRTLEGSHLTLRIFISIVDIVKITPDLVICQITHRRKNTENKFPIFQFPIVLLRISV